MLLKDLATNETMMDTDILGTKIDRKTLGELCNADKRRDHILVYVCVDRALSGRLETQILQDAGAGAADPHIDETAAKRKRTNDGGANKGQAAARDEGVQRRRAEDAVEGGDPVLHADAIVKHVAVDVVDVVKGRERDAPAGAHKVELRRARLAVVEGDHDDARYVRERGVDEQLLRRREELRLDAVRRRAEREERFGEQEDEFLPVVLR
jgi:hypothetical protein